MKLFDYAKVRYRAWKDELDFSQRTWPMYLKNPNIQVGDIVVFTLQTGEEARYKLVHTQLVGGDRPAIMTDYFYKFMGIIE